MSYKFRVLSWEAVGFNFYYSGIFSTENWAWAREHSTKVKASHSECEDLYYIRNNSNN